MRGLTIILAEASPVRFRSALTTALAAAALGARARLFLDAAAVPLVRLPIEAPDDLDQVRAGLPALGDLLAEALAAGVEVTACQTGLALCAATAADFPPAVTFGGVVGVIADLGEDRLLAF
jgi:predicted peroxiredoxin